MAREGSTCAFRHGAPARFSQGILSDAPRTPAGMAIDPPKGFAHRRVGPRSGFLCKLHLGSAVRECLGLPGRRRWFHRPIQVALGWQRSRPTRCETWVRTRDAMHTCSVGMTTTLADPWTQGLLELPGRACTLAGLSAGAAGWGPRRGNSRASGTTTARIFLREIWTDMASRHPKCAKPYASLRQGDPARDIWDSHLKTKAATRQTHPPS